MHDNHYVDFETYSEADLKKVGLANYIRHPSTKVLCLSYSINAQNIMTWRPGDPIPEIIARATNSDAVFCAHNAGFEIAVWNTIMHGKHKWPQLPPHRWRCTMAQCAFHALPRSLDAASKVLELGELKSDSGRRLMLKMCKPNRKGEQQNDQTDFARLIEYCEQDVRVDRLIGCRLAKPLANEQQIWLLNHEINQRGIPVDLEGIGHALAIEEDARKKDESRLRDLTNGNVKTARQNKALLTWLVNEGVDVDNLRAETVAKHLDIEYPSPVIDVLEIRRRNALSSTAKLTRMKEHAIDGRVRECHVYHGANTGRFSGAGIQIQNFPRGNMGPTEIEQLHQLLPSRDPELIEILFSQPATHCIRSMLRSFIKAPKGKRLLVCDFAGIEARVLAWLAGEQALLKLFKTGGDVYVDMASRIYGIPEEKVTKEQRHLGKVAILGLGYGMGAKKFRETAVSFGANISPMEAARVVRIYRDSYPTIRQFWWGLENHVRDTITTKQIRNYRQHEMRMRDGFLQIYLPGGRYLNFCRPYVRDEETPFGHKPCIRYGATNGYTHQWDSKTKTYGGKLAENITQAVARDLLTAAMLRLENNKYHIIGHVHDEVICEEDNGSDHSVEQMVKIMCRLPAWASGLPVAAEGFECERYRK